MSFCGLTEGNCPKMCILCVRVKINKSLFEPLCGWTGKSLQGEGEGRGGVAGVITSVKTKGLRGDVLHGPTNDRWNCPLCCFLPSLRGAGTE